MKSKEVFRFVVVGCLAVLTDYTIYYFSSAFISIVYSKVLSFVSGSFVAFLANKWWTFNHTGNQSLQILKFCLLYSVSLIGNTFINAFFFDILNDKIWAFIFATGFSAVLNFFGQKYWVFK
jgi:putative flippase GtrA